MVIRNRLNIIVNKKLSLLSDIMKYWTYN